MNITSRRRTLAGLAAVAMAGSVAVNSVAAAEPEDTTTSDYIVMLNDDTAVASVETAELTVSAVQRAQQVGADVTNEYKAIGGYAASMTAAQADEIAKDPAVKSVAPDFEVSIAGMTPMTDDVAANASSEQATGDVAFPDNLNPQWFTQWPGSNWPPNRPGNPGNRNPFPFPPNRPNPFPTNRPNPFPPNRPNPFPTNRPNPFPTNRPNPVPTHRPNPFPPNRPNPRPTTTSTGSPGGIFPDDPKWGLDRIDQRDAPLDGQPFRADGTGEGVHVYVIDTGIRAGHSEFTGRVGEGVDFVYEDGDPDDDHNFINVRGHGTMSASIAVGNKWGVAKGATVHALKALDSMGNGKGKHMMAAIDWVAGNAELPAVVNMSTAADANDTMNDGVDRMIAAGAIVVGAAGNDNDDACKRSPASAKPALTVTASDHKDKIAPAFPNWGSCVDLIAPGYFVGGASNENDNASQKAQGTSQAAPYVAGAAAVYLGNNPDATMAEVHKALVDRSTQGKIGGELRGTPNRLLYVGDLR